jgi:hypothetical protein
MVNVQLPRLSTAGYHGLLPAYQQFIPQISPDHYIISVGTYHHKVPLANKKYKKHLLCGVRSQLPNIIPK